MTDPIQNQMLIQIYEKMQKATEQLYDDYVNDKELTALTVLDSEDFVNEERDNPACSLTGI